VVPMGTPLVIEARIRPDDIDEVMPGMKAMVRISAFKTRSVPKIPATVVTVSADRLIDQQNGAPYFVAELSIDNDDLKVLPPGSHISPGMPAEVMIATGERTILSYFTRPLVTGLDRSFRETDH